jgi:bifunctional non-homologous end joining protein LigD
VVGGAGGSSGAGLSGAGASGAGAGGAPAEWQEPMLATATHPPAVLAGGAEQWQVEPKLDGLRCLAVRNGPVVDLWSRNRLSWTARFPDVVAALAALPATSFVIDGELVSYDAAGRTSFGQLQSRRSGAPVLVAFDLLHLLGRSVTGLALEERRRLLQMTLEVPAPSGVAGSSPVGSGAAGSGRVRLIEILDGAPAELLELACASGWEGILCKRRRSLYTPGRGPAWRKLKCSASQEIVIGGWTPPTGSRVGLGALMAGYWAGDMLTYAGKVGTGFTYRMLRELAASLARLETPECPFAPAPKVRGARWVRPELVAAVTFTEWTTDGRMRHPSFQGLREDRDPRSVVRERPAST